MIDFTKEELIDIRRCVNPVLIGDAAYPLQEKIQSLIDNYCDKPSHDGIECEGRPCSGKIWSAS